MFDCEHREHYIQGGHGSAGDESVWVCLKCGEFRVTAQKDGVHFSIRFHLFNNLSLIAASQAIRSLNRGEVASDGSYRVWKPLDFANLRLYQVHLHVRMKNGNESNEHYVVAADSPNQSDFSAANLIREIYGSSLKSNPDVSYWDAKGYALNILQPKSWTENGIDLLRDAFVEGEFVCPECGGRAAQKDGDVGTCPADGATMVPLRWRQAAAEAGEIAQRHKKYAGLLEKAWPEGHAMPVDDGETDGET